MDEYEYSDLYDYTGGDSDYQYSDMYDYGTDYGVDEIFPQGGGSWENGWRYFSDGTAIAPASQGGGYYYDNKLIWSPSGEGGLAGIGKSAVDALMKAFQKPASQGGGVDWQKIATIGGGVAGLLGLGKSEQKPTGYQGGIPKYTAVREQVPGSYDAERRPGSSGQRYFSQTQYVPSSGDVAAARAAAAEEASGLRSVNAASPAREEMAAGGIAGLKKGRYLNGATDGMADKISTTIDNKQPAALSHGEFVLPADIVSHLGNGNSEAGAKKLYDMMDRIRKARTGTTKQGKRIDPNKYLPS